MKEKVIIFKNDSIGDLVHSVSAINNIILQNQDKEVIIFLSNISEKFYFLFKKNNTQLKVLNFNLSFIEKIKVFFYLLRNKIKKIYILSPKKFYFYLPLFFLRIKFFGLCVNGIANNKRPSLFLRKFLYKFVVNDRKTKKKRKSTRSLQLELVSENKEHSSGFDLNLHVPISEKLEKYLPNNYVFIHYKKLYFEELGWGTSELETILSEVNKYIPNIVLTKDIELDENNEIFKKKFNTYDLKKEKFYSNSSNVIFLDNLRGSELYNVIKRSKKIIAIHGIMTNLGFLCKKPVLDFFRCVINNKDDFYSNKNAFYEFKPKYEGYDFIIPSRDIKKTIKKMKFALVNIL
jgi:hypothetical protein